MKQRTLAFVFGGAAVGAIWITFLVSHIILLTGVNTLLMKEADRLQAASKHGRTIDFTQSVANIDDATIGIGLARDVEAIGAILSTAAALALVY